MKEKYLYEIKGYKLYNAVLVFGGRETPENNMSISKQLYDIKEVLSEIQRLPFQFI